MFRPTMRFPVLVMAVFVLGFPAVSPVAAQVQSNAADLAGVVTDPQGARIPGAQITARNLATNQTRTVSTDVGGRFAFVGDGVPDVVRREQHHAAEQPRPPQAHCPEERDTEKISEKNMLDTDRKNEK